MEENIEVYIKYPGTERTDVIKNVPITCSVEKLRKKIIAINKSSVNPENVKIIHFGKILKLTDTIGTYKKPNMKRVILFVSGLKLKENQQEPQQPEGPQVFQFFDNVNNNGQQNPQQRFQFVEMQNVQGDIIEQEIRNLREIASKQQKAIKIMKICIIMMLVFFVIISVIYFMLQMIFYEQDDEIMKLTKKYKEYRDLNASINSKANNETVNSNREKILNKRRKERRRRVIPKMILFAVFMLIIYYAISRVRWTVPMFKEAVTLFVMSALPVWNNERWLANRAYNPNVMF